ncbi:MAG: hypothetical protein RIE52_11845 [Balneola sp.]
MAFATVYQFSDSNTPNRTTRTVRIMKDGFVGSSDTIDVESLVIKPSSVNDFFKIGVLNQIMEMSFFDKDYTNNGYVSDTLNDINPLEWRIEVEGGNYGGVSTSAIIFYGVPLVEYSGSPNFDNDSRRVLRASYGTQNLATIPYLNYVDLPSGITNSGNIEELPPREFHIIISDCLRVLHDINISFLIEWKEDNASGSWKPDLLRINQQDLLRGLINPSFKDVLDRMCESFDLQIYQTANKWIVKEVNYFDTGSTFTSYDYSTAGTKTTDAITPNLTKSSSDFFDEGDQLKLNYYNKIFVNTINEYDDLQILDDDFSLIDDTDLKFYKLEAGVINSENPGMRMVTVNAEIYKDATRVVQGISNDDKESLNISLGFNFRRLSAVGRDDGSYSIEYCRVMLIPSVSGSTYYLDNDGSWGTSVNSLSYDFSITSEAYSDTGSGAASTVSDTDSIVTDPIPDAETAYILRLYFILGGDTNLLDSVNYMTYSESTAVLNNPKPINKTLVSTASAGSSVIKELERTVYLFDKSEYNRGSIEYYDGSGWEIATAFNARSFNEELAYNILSRQQNQLIYRELSYYEDEAIYHDNVIYLNTSKYYMIHGLLWSIFGADYLTATCIEINIDATGISVSQSYL